MDNRTLKYFIIDELKKELPEIPDIRAVQMFTWLGHYIKELADKDGEPKAYSFMMSILNTPLHKIEQFMLLHYLEDKGNLK